MIYDYNGCRRIPSIAVGAVENRMVGAGGEESSAPMYSLVQIPCAPYIVHKLDPTYGPCELWL